MPIDWIKIKDICGDDHFYRVGPRGNAIDIRVSERKITVTSIGEDGPFQRIFLKSNIIYYEYTSEHLRRKYGD